MRRIMMILSGLLFFHTWLAAQTGEKNFIDQNYIEVRGSADMEVIPDEIYIRIVLDERENKGKLDLKQLEKSFFSILEREEIDVKADLSVRDASSQYKNKKSRSAEVLATKTYLLRVSSADKAGTLLADFDDAGIANVSIDRVSHSQIEQLRRDVKVMAVKAAKEKAKELTEAIGQEIGRAIYIQESSDVLFRPLSGRLPGVMVSNMSMSRNVAEEELNPSVDFEKIKLEYSVLVRFELY